MMQSQRQSIRKETAWVLSNFTASTVELLQECIDKGIIDALCYLLINDVAAVKMEAVWALSNATCTAEPK